MGLATAIANLGGLSAALPAIPVTNLLGAWEATATGTAGAGGTLSLNDLSGNGHPLASTSGANPIVLTASDSKCGGSPTVASTVAAAGASATLAAYSTPVTAYVVGYTTATNGDIFQLGVTIVRLFVQLSGSAETWIFRVPNSSNQISDAHGANTTASVVCCTIPVTAGTFNSYVGQSTPATATGTAGTIPTGQTLVQICAAGGNAGGSIFGLYLYSGADSQATRFASMNVFAQRANLAPILT